MKTKNNWGGARLESKLIEKYADQWIVLLDDYCSNKISYHLHEN